MPADAYTPAELEAGEENIPTELTATPHVGIGGARRRKLARAVLAAAAPLIGARVRAEVAEEAALLMQAEATGDAAPTLLWAAQRIREHFAAKATRAHATTKEDHHGQ